jgi:hypothetical protein
MSEPFDSKYKLFKQIGVPFSGVIEQAEDMKTYEIAWVKNYHMGNSVLIEAETEEEALEIARDNIGNYEGSMQYDPDEDWVESWGEKVLDSQ